MLEIEHTMYATSTLYCVPLLRRSMSNTQRTRTYIGSGNLPTSSIGVARFMFLAFECWVLTKRVRMRVSVCSCSLLEIEGPTPPYTSGGLGYKVREGVCPPLGWHPSEEVKRATHVLLEPSVGCSFCIRKHCSVRPLRGASRCGLCPSCRLVGRVRHSCTCGTPVPVR